MFFHRYILFVCLPGILTKSIQNVTNEADHDHSLRKELENLKSKVENLTVQLQHVTYPQQRTVFFVKLSPTITLNKNSIVRFDTVIVDEGNNFNTGDGIFVSPVSGMFLFSWTQFAPSSKATDTELRVDNVVVDSMDGYIGTSSAMPATKVVIYKVKKGDHVWIQTSRHYTENVFTRQLDSRSSFIGLLLYAI